MAISMKKEQMKIYVVAATRERGQEIAHAHRHFAERVHIVSTWHEWGGADALVDALGLKYVGDLEALTAAFRERLRGMDDVLVKPYVAVVLKGGR